LSFANSLFGYFFVFAFAKSVISDSRSTFAPFLLTLLSSF